MSRTLNSAIAVVGIDIGKNSFHIVGLDRRGAIVLRQKWSRGQVEARLANMPPCLIGMEACVGAHHLSRRLKAPDAEIKNARKRISWGEQRSLPPFLPVRLSLGFGGVSKAIRASRHDAVANILQPHFAALILYAVVKRRCDGEVLCESASIAAVRQSLVAFRRTTFAHGRPSIAAEMLSPN